MAAKTIGVSWWEAGQRWRKYIGNHRGRDGSLKPKIWYFGQDEREAIKRAIELTAEWIRLRRDGVRAWPSKNGGERGRAGARDDLLDLTDLTVGRAAALYIESIRKKTEALQRSWAYVHSVKTLMGCAFAALGQHTRLNDIEEAEIEDVECDNCGEHHCVQRAWVIRPERPVQSRCGARCYRIFGQHCKRVGLPRTFPREPMSAVG